MATLPTLGLYAGPQRRQLRPLRRTADERVAFEGLLERGVLVRDVGLRHHLRVDGGTPAETTAFLSALGPVAAARAGAPARERVQSVRSEDKESV